MKKKNIYLIIVIAMLVLAGCKPKDEATFYIPTAPDDNDVTEDELFFPDESSEYGEQDYEAEEPFDMEEPLYVGSTTKKYVKLSNYDALLNIRSEPKKDGEVVGKLAHTDQVEVIEIVDGWASFVFKNKICYVSEEFLVDRKPPYIEPPTPTPIPSPTTKPAGNDGPREI